MDKNSLNAVASALRQTFQELLKRAVKDHEDREELAQVIDRSPSQIKAMLYQGKGGLDSWVKAFAYIYDLDKDSLDKFKRELKKGYPLSRADEIWFSLDDEGASEDDKLYLAHCAKEAFRIKKELKDLRKK